MDGNGRWAKQRGLPRTEGHAAGEEALFDTVDGALDIGLEWLTVFAFSTENWKRPPGGGPLPHGLQPPACSAGAATSCTSEDVASGSSGGATGGCPRSVLKEMDAARRADEAQPQMTLTIAFNYGGRTEIVDAVKALLEDHDAGGCMASGSRPSRSPSRLYLPDMPDPDLLIRTGGEMRISNFLLWQAAYAELWFTPVYWPDFGRENLYEAIRDYQKRDRRFGRIEDDSSQLLDRYHGGTPAAAASGRERSTP